MARYLTTAQACTALGLAPATLRDWKRRGLLTPYSRAGERVWRLDQLAAAQDAPKRRRAA